MLRLALASTLVHALLAAATALRRRRDPAALAETLELGTGAGAGAGALAFVEQDVFAYEGFAASFKGKIHVAVKTEAVAVDLPPASQHNAWFAVHGNSPLKKLGFHKWRASAKGFHFKHHSQTQEMHCVAESARRHTKAMVLGFACDRHATAAPDSLLQGSERYEAAGDGQTEYKGDDDSKFWSYTNGAPYGWVYGDWTDHWGYKYYGVTPGGYFGCDELNGSYCASTPVIYPRVYSNPGGLWVPVHYTQERDQAFTVDGVPSSELNPGPVNEAQREIDEEADWEAEDKAQAAAAAKADAEEGIIETDKSTPPPAAQPTITVDTSSVEPPPDCKDCGTPGGEPAKYVSVLPSSDPLSASPDPALLASPPADGQNKPPRVIEY